MTSAKRHHYLPQFYLEGFTDTEGLLWVYDREQKKLRKQPPKDTAVQGYYYAFTDKHGNKRNDIEEFFSRVESETKPLLEKIDQGDLPSTEEKLTLAVFVGFQKTRVPDFEKSVDEAGEKMIKRMNEFMFQSEETASQTVRGFEAKTGSRLKCEPKDLVEFVQSGEYAIEFPREHSIKLMMDLGMDMVGPLVQMNWTFIQAPGRSSFISSDNPFVLVPPSEWDPKGFYGVGIATPGAAKVIPLSAKTCLLIGDYGDSLRISQGNQGLIRNLNLNIAINSDRFIIGRAEELLKRIVDITKVDQWRKKQRVSVS